MSTVRLAPFRSMVSDYTGHWRAIRDIIISDSSEILTEVKCL